MRWLVTGGLGVVGSLFAEERLQAGDEVFVIDAAEQPRQEYTRKKLESIPAALELTSSGGSRLGRLLGRVEELTRAEWEVFLHDVDAVVHAAAHTGIPHSAEDPGDDWRSNVDATRVLLEALRTCGRKIPTVVMSSVKPYSVDRLHVQQVGDRYVWDPASPFWDIKVGINEHWPLEPDEPYAASKMAQSAIAMAYARTYDLPIVTLRFSNLYGPAPCHGPRHGWLTWFCLQQALGQVPEIQGTGLQVRDMLYSADINAALRLAIEHADKLAGRVFNVGGGQRNSVSVMEAFKMLWGPIGRVRHAEGRKREDPIFITDHRAFTEATGWEPKVSVADGVARVCEWARENQDALRELYAEHLR